jgi:hypothetical protein
MFSTQEELVAGRRGKEDDDGVEKEGDEGVGSDVLLVESAAFSSSSAVAVIQTPTSR